MNDFVRNHGINLVSKVDEHEAVRVPTDERDPQHATMQGHKERIRREILDLVDSHPQSAVAALFHLARRPR